MRIHTSLFLALSAFFWACPAQAAITLRVAPTTQTVQPGQVVTVQVTVEGFTDVAAYQFSMQWDPAVLQFQSIGYNLAGLSASNFNTLNTASGSLTTAYLPSPAATLPNGASLFSLQFLALGAAGGSTNVAFSGSPTAIAFYNSAVQRQLVTVLDGQVGIQAAGTFSVSGNVRRNSGPAVPGATVAMSGTSTGTDLTNSAGNYLFPNLAAGSNLTLTPTKSTDFQECVSVRDMLFISKHILGIAPLGSPYQMIEADVNQSGSITAFDITQIRDLVLGKIAQFPSSDSWRFVPADFVFPNPFNPFTSVFPENSGITNLQADATRDFIGMKIGDATDCAGDAHGPAFLTLTAPHMTASTGNNINLAITSQGFANVSGLQFSLSWNPAVLQFNGITSLLPGWGSTAYYANGGNLSVCWANTAPSSLPDGSAVFTLQFTVLGSAGAVSPLAFTETPTRSEVVDGMCNPFDLNKLDGSVTVPYPPCPLFCNDLVTVALNDNCEAVIDHTAILEGTICPGNYVLDVYDSNNVLLLAGVNPAVLTGSMSYPLRVTVTYLPTGNKCFGIIALARPCEACCQSEQAFLDKARQGFAVFQQKCGVSVVPKVLGDCQRTTYDWGDGSTTGPLVGNAPASHIYSAPGYYTVCAKVEELNLAGAVCFVRDSCWNFCAVCDTCQNPILKNEWAQFPATTQYLGGNNSYAQMYADAAGNFWATTTFGGNFDNGPDPDLTNQGALDCIVAKYKSDGTLASGFAFHIGGTGDEIGAVMAPHPSGGFYVGGISYSPTLTLPSPGGATPTKTLTNSALQNIFLCRYDASRNLLWALGMHGSNNLQINEMATDNSGNVYITGLAHGPAIDFNPLGAAVVFPNLNEGYVCKYDSNGLLLWVRLMSGTLHLGLTLDASGNVYIGGHFQGTPTLSGWPLPGGSFPPVGIGTAFPSTASVAPHVAKFDNSGGFQWAFAIQNTAQTSTGVVWDMKASSNHLYIGGVIEANVPTNFDPRGGNAALQGLSFAQAGFVARYDLNGHGQISKPLPQYHNLYEIEVGPGGKIYTAGYYGGSVLLADVYDTDLNLAKSLQTGLGTVADVAWAIAPDPFGDLGMVGRIGSQQFDADPQANDGFEQVFTDGLQHLFIGKYTCDCPGEPIAPCGPCDSISTSLIHKTSDLGCCAAIKVNNQLPGYFTGVQVSVVSGGSLFLTNVTPRPGWKISGFVNGSSVTLAPTGGGFFPTGNLDCAFLCMDDLSAADQYLEVQYFGSDGDTLCRDTLHFACDFCIAITRDSIGCDSAGLKKMKFCVQVAPNLGWDVNALVLMLPPGVTASPAVFSLSDVPPGTEHCYLTTYLSIPSGTHPDSLCIGFTAHEQDVTKGLPPLRCCMVKQCFALPLCLCDPDVTYATASGGQFGDRNCCWDIALHQVPGTVYAVQTNILNPQGVSFGAVAPIVGWDMVPRSATSLLWTPDPSGNLPASVSLPTLCLQAQGQYASPQLLEIVWFTTTDTIACRDTLTFRCAPDTLCVWLDSMSLVCSQPLPGHNIYTVTVANPFYPVPPPARPIPTHVAVVDVNPASALVGTGVFAIGSLPPGSSTTISIPFNGPPGTVVCFGLNMYRNALPNIFEDCCVTEDTFCVTLRDCDLTPNPNPISIYPNPTRGNITLDFGNTSSPALGRVLVRDLTGRLLREEEVPEGSLKYVVEMPSLGSGLYFVEFMEDRTRVKTEKLSVIR